MKLSAPLYITAAVLTAIVINTLLFFYTPGISFPITTFILVIIYEVVRMVRAGKFSVNKYHLLLLPVLYFSLIPAMRIDGFVLFWSLNLFTIIASLYVLATAHPTFFQKFSGFELIEAGLKVVAAPFTQLKKIFQTLTKGSLAGAKKGSQSSRNFTKVFIGIGITFPVFVVVLSLLASSDEIFNKVITETFRFVIPDISFNSVFKFLFALSVSIFGWFGLLGIIESDIFTKKRINAAILDKIAWDVIIPGILMYSLVVIYLVFIVIQFGYIFGGEEFTHQYGIIFSEYAVKGFWEMITVSLINFVIIYFVQTRFSFRSIQAKSVLWPAVSLIIISTFVMLYSSHLRLTVYESGYGYTLDRLIPHIFLLFIAAVFALSTVNVFLPDEHRRRVLNIGTAIIATLFIMGNGMFSMERFIVEKNIEKYINRSEESTVILDMNYLANDLGIEGALALIEHKDSDELSSYFSDLEDLDDNAQYSQICDEECMDAAIVSTISKAHTVWGLNWQSTNLVYERAEENFNALYYDINLFRNLTVEGYEFEEMGGSYSYLYNQRVRYENEDGHPVTISSDYKTAEEIENLIDIEIGFAKHGYCPPSVTDKIGDRHDIMICSENIPQIFTKGNMVIEVQATYAQQDETEIFSDVYNSFFDEFE